MIGKYYKVNTWGENIEVMIYIDKRAYSIERYHKLRTNIKMRISTFAIELGIDCYMREFENGFLIQFKRIAKWLEVYIEDFINIVGGVMLDKPIEVTQLDLSLGIDIKRLMPEYEDIPMEFKKGETKWNDFFNVVFFGDVKDYTLIPKEDIDMNMAIRHIKAIMCSFEPKHEHKEAACSYLFDKFFKEVTWVIK